MSSPAVSVVMPVYNAERYVGEAVDSILAQTFSDYEFLIFDDGSTDRSLAILESYAQRDRRIRLLGRPHRGYVPWLNEGLRLAKGEFIARMDADDVSLPTRLARQVQYLREHGDCVAVGTDALLVDADGAPICELTHDVDHERIEADLLGGGHGVIAHPTSMMRRATVLDIGGYREEFEPIEDFDLWFRLVERGRLANIPEVLFMYRQHRASVTIAQADRQGACADVIITEARRRRGLPPLGHSVWNYTPPDVPESHRQWALLAVGSGFRETASKHARRALAKQPWSLRSWAVFARCCLPDGVVRILKRLGVGSVWRRALCGGEPRRRAAAALMSLQTGREESGSTAGESAEERSSSPAISVVLCTYNRAAFLPAALASLVGQSLEKSEYEIVVVDNGSTDETATVVRSLQHMYRQPAIDLVVDREPGLAHARNTGISRARGALVAFIDDDAEASRDWLKRMLECFRDVQPQPWGIGGMVVPIYDSPKPQWFKDEYETDTWGDRRRFLTRRETFSGNNMAFVKKVIEASGGFELGAGMRGDRLSLGEETALLERIWRQRGEGRFYYCPEAVVFHRIGPHKMTVSYHLKRYFVAGQVWPVTHPPSAPDRVRRSIRSAASVLWHSATAAATMARYHCWQQWMVERLGPVAYELGRLLGCAGVVLQMRRGA